MFDQIAHYKAVRARIANAAPLRPTQKPTSRFLVSPPPVISDPAPDDPTTRRARLLAGAPSSERIRRAVFATLDKHGVGWREIFNRSRVPHLARMRWLVFRDMAALGLSLYQIGRLTDYDHTTVLYGLRTLAKEEADDVAHR